MTEHGLANSRNREGESVSIKEALSRHAGQWVLMRVTKLGERQEPEAGQILGAWPPGRKSEKAISREFARLARSPDRPDEPYYLFEARLPGSPQPPLEATGDLVARVVAVIGERGAGRRR